MRSFPRDLPCPTHILEKHPFVQDLSPLFNERVEELTWLSSAGFSSKRASSSGSTHFFRTSMRSTAMRKWIKTALNSPFSGLKLKNSVGLRFGWQLIGFRGTKESSRPLNHVRLGLPIGSQKVTLGIPPSTRRVHPRLWKSVVGRHGR